MTGSPTDPGASKDRPGTGPGVLARDGFALAIGTLTALPTPSPTAVNPRVAGLAMVLGPLVLLPVTLGASLVGWFLVTLGTPPMAAGFAGVGMLLLGTRAIHVDGLADTVDGMGASWNRARALAVMRRGDVGPMGATALIVVLALQASCLGAILTTPGGWAYATVLLAASRAATATGARSGIPAARREGLGQAVAGSVSWPRWAACWLLTGAVVVTAASLSGRSVIGAAAAVVAAALAAEAALAAVVRRLGGITGDVLGALVETAAVMLLLGATL